MNYHSDSLPKQPNGFSKANQNETIVLYPGIELHYLTLLSDSVCMQHKISGHTMQINYCKAGQIAWEIGNQRYIYLNPGNFSLHTMNACTDSIMISPAGQYQGLTICIDLQESSAHPPELFKDTNLFYNALREKFCRNDTAAFLAGNEQTEGIFSAFYNQPEHLRRPYQKIKILELFLYLSKMEFTPQNQLAEYQSEQIDIIRNIHDRLIQNLAHRITIEELSRQYLINPTTLKAAFKAVYGTSIAAHMKEHRMEQAAKLLRESDMSIAKIALAVGYDSQSKFSAAFKAFFQVLPKEYRKQPF